MCKIGGPMQIKKWLKVLAVLLFSPYVLGGVEIVERVCVRQGFMDCSLVKAMSWTESKHKNVVIPDSGSLSYGPLQIKCLTARHMGFRGRCKELMIAETSLYYGIKYIEYQLKRYNNNYYEAVAAYNSGRGIRCQYHNPGKCRPGELYNKEHVSRVKKRYLWLKNKSPRILDRFLASFNNWVGFENSTTVFKRDFLILLVSTEEEDGE
jgi:hypothetical protein